MIDAAARHRKQTHDALDSRMAYVDVGAGAPILARLGGAAGA